MSSDPAARLDAARAAIEHADLLTVDWRAS